MLPVIPDPVVAVANKSAARLVLVFLAVPAAAVSMLVVFDALKHRQRSKRPNFPHPGVFDGRVADSGVTIYTYVEDL